MTVCSCPSRRDLLKHFWGWLRETEMANWLRHISSEIASSVMVWYFPHQHIIITIYTCITLWNIKLIRITVRLGLNLENPKEFTLDTYKEHFENEFLTATEIYYTIESSAFIPANGICEYMKRVEFRIEQEEGRVQKYLHASTRDPVCYSLSFPVLCWLFTLAYQQTWSSPPS